MLLTFACLPALTTELSPEYRQLGGGDFLRLHQKAGPCQLHSPSFNPPPPSPLTLVWRKCIGQNAKKKRVKEIGMLIRDGGVWFCYIGRSLPAVRSQRFGV